MKILAIVSAVSLLAIAAMGVWVKSLKADNAVLVGQLVERDRVIVKANREIGALKVVLTIKDIELKLERNLRTVGNVARATAEEATKQLIAGTTQNAQDIAHAQNEDAAAAPILSRHARELREFDARYADLRARGGEGQRLPGSGDPAGSARIAALGVSFTQRQFGDACLSIKNSLARLVGNVIGVADWERGYNDNIRKRNAEAAAAVSGG